MADPTRRQILNSAIAVPLASLAACHDDELLRRTRNSPESTVRSTPLTQRSWAELRKALHGTVTLPSDAGFAASHRLFNPDFDTRRPAAVVQAASQQDVAVAVKFAASHRLKATARCGGHSYVGASGANGALVIDLRQLADVSYDARTGGATIGAGARLYDVHATLDRVGRTIPTGTCPTVGVSGLATGGGLGVLSRETGLTCDVVASADVVLPDGRSITASSRVNNDLLWALQGGGGGAVGIVTRWTFATVAARRSGSFVLDLPAGTADRVVLAVRGWGQWVTTAPRSQWANLHITRTTRGVSVRAVGVCRDGDEKQAARSLAAACGAPGATATLASRSHMETVRWLGGGTTSARTPFTAGSDVLRTLDEATARAVVAAVQAAPAGCVAILDPLTGAIQDVPVSTTAFPWRRHIATVQWYSGSTAPSARRWITAAHHTLGEHSGGGYLNYVEPGDALGRYLGPNTRRLAAIRQKYRAGGSLVSSIGA